MTPDPTPAELDEWERTYAEFPVVPRLIKALRACCQESRTKDVAIEAMRLTLRRGRISGHPI